MRFVAALIRATRVIGAIVCIGTIIAIALTVTPHAIAFSGIIEQLQNISSNTSALTANIDKRNLFALADWYIWPVDVKNASLIKMPYIVTGVSMASKPLHGILAGVGWGPAIVNFYAGFLIVTNHSCPN
jgi:hypothetical protein